jgi:hypothetical protein
MDYQATPLNRLHLWTILAHGGSVFNALLRPPMDSKDRGALLALGFIEAFKDQPSADERKRINRLSRAKKGEAAKAPEAKKARRAAHLKLRLAPAGRALLAGDPT